eukprot:UN29334
MALSNKSHILATSSDNEKFITVRNLKKNLVVHRLGKTNEKTFHQSYIYDMHIQTKYLVSCGHDKSIKIWDIESGKLLKTLHGHSASVWCCRLSGKHLYSGSFDNR